MCCILCTKQESDQSLEKNNDMLYNETDSDNNAFATPRTWEMASKMIYGEKPEDTEMLLIPVLGPKVACSFATFVTLVSKKIDIDKIIENPEMLRDYDDDASLSLSIATLLAKQYVRANDKERHAKIIKAITSQLAVMAMLSVRHIIKKDKSKLNKLLSNKEVGPLVVNLLTKLL